MSKAEFVKRVPTGPTLNEEAYRWFKAFIRSQHNYMKEQGWLREALLAHAEFLQEEFCHGEATEPHYRRAMPYAEECDCIMRAVAGSLSDGIGPEYMLGKLEVGYGCFSGSLKRDKEDPRDPLGEPLAYVDIGTHDDLIALCDEIEKKVQPVSEGIIQLLLPRFKASEHVTLEAHTFMVEELGLREGGSYSQVLGAARECGLTTLPVDAPLLLLLRPLKLFGEDKYIVATEPIDKRLFQLCNSRKGLDLEVRQTEFRYGPKTRFIFRRYYPRSEE